MRRALPIRALGLLFAAALLLATAQASAQGSTAQTPTPAEAAPAKPRTIPITEISARAEQLDDKLRGIDAELAAADTTHDVEEQLKVISEDAASSQKQLDDLLAAPHAPGDLSGLAASSAGLARRVASAEASLTAHAVDLEQSIGEVRADTELWKRTRTTAREASVPKAVSDQISAALTSLRSVGRALEKSRNNVLDLQTRLQTQSRAAKLAVQRIATAQRDLRDQLFTRDAKPLWAASFREELLAELEQFGSILRRAGSPLVDYVLRHEGRVILQGLLLLGLIWAARRGAAWLQREEGATQTPERERSALRHPWAAGLLLGVAGTTLFHPEAPRALALLVNIAALWPWRRLLAHELPAALRAPLNGLAVLLFVDLLRSLLEPAELIARGLLIVELALGITGLIWLRRPGRLSQLPALIRSARWLGALDVFLRLSLASFLAGLAAAASGYGNLAALLAHAPIYSSFIGTVMILGVRILEELVGIAIASGALDRARLVRARPASVTRFTSFTLRIAAAGIWGYLVLQRSGLWSPTRSLTETALSAPIGYGTLSLTLGGVLAFGLTLWLSWVIARFVSLVMDHEVFTRVRMPQGVPFALLTFTRYAILVAGFLLAVSMIGFSIDRLTLVLSALGVGIGFGLQNVINNFVSGVIMLFERPVRVGDRVQLDELLGDVTSIGLRASKVRTTDGSDVIVPNGDFISARVINWTLSDSNRRIILPVGVAYGTRPQDVLQVLERVARANPDVLERPEPEILFRAFGDSSLDFEIRAWAKSDAWLRVTSDLAVATYDALAEAGIQIPFPQHDLHLKSVHPEARQALGQARPAGDGPPEEQR